MKNRYSGKTVWITGASAGIGKDLAIALSKLGSKLILSARSADKLEAVSEECLPGSAIIQPFDLADSTSINHSVSAVLERHKSVDILINNGGISQRSLASQTKLEVDRKIMEVNYFGQIALTKALLPGMIEKKSGKIVVISSIMGQMTTALRSSYCASKHALHGFFDALRSEIHKEGIKVLMVCPAAVQTDISVNALTENGSFYGQMDPQQQNGMPVSECTRLIIKAMDAGKEEVLIGSAVKNAVYIRRFFPGLFSRIIRNVKVT